MPFGGAEFNAAYSLFRGYLRSPAGAEKTRAVKDRPYNNLLSFYPELICLI